MRAKHCFMRFQASFGKKRQIYCCLNEPGVDFVSVEAVRCNQLLLSKIIGLDRKRNRIVAMSTNLVHRFILAGHFYNFLIREKDSTNRMRVAIALYFQMKVHDFTSTVVG